MNTCDQTYDVDGVHVKGIEYWFAGGGEPRAESDPRDPGAPPAAGEQVAHQEDQAPPAARAQALPRGCQAGRQQHLYEMLSQSTRTDYPFSTISPTVQVLDWLEKHGEVFLRKNVGIGRNLAKSRAYQKSHETFEGVVQVGNFTLSPLQCIGEFKIHKIFISAKAYFYRCVCVCICICIDLYLFLYLAYQSQAITCQLRRLFWRNAHKISWAPM